MESGEVRRCCLNENLEEGRRKRLVHGVLESSPWLVGFQVVGLEDYISIQFNKVVGTVINQLVRSNGLVVEMICMQSGVDGGCLDGRVEVVLGEWSGLFGPMCWSGKPRSSQ